MSETTNFNLSKPAQGALDWDTDLNANFDIIDSEIKEAQTLTSSKITTALGFTPQNVTQKGAADGYASLNATGKVPLTQIALNSSAISTALGFTPQNPASKDAANGYAGLDGNGKILSSKISLTLGTITTALNFTPESVSNKGQADGYASLDSNGKVPANQIALTEQQVLDAVGYTPESVDNKDAANGYPSLNGSSKVSSSQISLTSTKITTALGFTPENINNKGANSGYASLDGSGKIPLSQHPSLSLSSLSGVSLSAPSSNQVLQYNGTNWVNASVSSGVTSLAAMGDVQLSSLSNGEVLQYNGTKWVDSTISERCTVPVRQTVLNGSVLASTGTANFLSAGIKTPTQYIVEVYNNLAADGATITELRAYNQDNAEITYTVTSTDAYDSRRNGVPQYWNDSYYWMKSNLNDNDTTYTGNSNGSSSSVIFVHNNGTAGANSQGWARFLITLSSSNYNTITFKLWAGSPENRIPEKITIYAVTGTYSLSTHIQTRSLVGLTEAGSRTFTLSDTAVTQTSHSYTVDPTVNLSATSTNVSVAFASGFDSSGAVDYVSVINADVSPVAFGLRAGSANYIYVDRNPSTGALTYGSTLVKPLYQQIDPVSGTPDSIQYMLLSSMTADNVPSPYVASSSSVLSASYAAYRAFDGNSGTNFVFGSGQTTGWLRIDLGSGNQFVAKAYAYTGHVNTPSFNGKTWTFEGSNNGNDWTTIDSKVNVSWSNGERKYITVSNSTAYRYYRLNITANNGGVECQVNEFQIYGVPNNQHWFDLNTMTMKVWNGNSWETKQRVFLGEADTVGNVTTYALQGKYESDIIAIGSNLTYTVSHNVGTELVNTETLIRYNANYKWTDAAIIYTGNWYGVRTFLADRNRIRLGTPPNRIGYGGTTVNSSEWGPWTLESFPSGVQTTAQAKVLVNRNW
jgi:hypothetical protein